MFSVDSKKYLEIKKNPTTPKRANQMNEDRGSYRDPAGQICYHDEKVFRKINKEGQTRLEFLIQNNIIDESIEKNYLIHSKKISRFLIHLLILRIFTSITKSFMRLI